METMRANVFRGVNEFGIEQVPRPRPGPAVQVDLSYPLRPLVVGGGDTYFHVQYFNGFAKSRLDYREHRQTLRAGVSFVR